MQLNHGGLHGVECLRHGVVKLPMMQIRNLLLIIIYLKSRKLANGKTVKGFGQRMGLRLIDQIDHVEEVTASTLAEKVCSWY